MYDQEIKEALHQFIDNYFEQISCLKAAPVISLIDAKQSKVLENWKIPREPQMIQDVMTMMKKNIYDYSTKLNHSRYLGFVPGPANLLSWVGDVMTNAYNLHATSWLSTSAASTIERKTIRFLGKQAGYDQDKCGGLFVSGGSMGNLTAVVTARQQVLKGNDIEKSVAYLSKEAHSSLKKALMVAGISHEYVRIIDTYDNGSMNLDLLKKSIASDQEAGLKPFLIVGNAGATNTGAIDNFKEIGKIAKKYNLWFHVDGAYGASVLLSTEYCDMLEEISAADSISWDGHKWLFQTYGCGILLVKNQETLIQTYHAHPDYLRDLQTENYEINYMDYGIELTRPARALKLWLTLQTLGLDQISCNISKGIKLAEYFQEQVMKYEHWEIVSPAKMAIMCFRYSDNLSLKQLNSINEAISKQMLDSNYAGIFTSMIDDKVVLRVCTINPETSNNEVNEIMERLDNIAKKIKEKMEEKQC